MNYIRFTHEGLDYAKVEVYDPEGNVEEYEVNKHIGDAVRNMEREIARLQRVVVRVREIVEREA